MNNLDFSEALNLLDFGLIGILLLSLVLGIFRGLIREILSVAAWILAVWLAQQYRDDISAYFPDWLRLEILPDIAKFSIVFLCTLVVLFLGAWMINKIIQISVPAVMNRMFGAGFGIVRGLLICTLLLYVVQHVAIADSQYQNSVVATYFSWAMNWMAEVAPEIWLQEQ